MSISVGQHFLLLLEFFNVPLVLADRPQKTFRRLLVREEFAGQKLRLADSSFDFDEMEGPLDLRVGLDQGIHL